MPELPQGPGSNKEQYNLLCYPTDKC